MGGDVEAGDGDGAGEVGLFEGGEPDGVGNAGGVLGVDACPGEGGAGEEGARVSRSQGDG